MSGTDLLSSVLLQSFYRQVAAPLLRRIAIQFPEDSVSDVTQNRFDKYFSGSELVVAGKVLPSESNTLTSFITASAVSSRRRLRTRSARPGFEGSLSRRPAWTSTCRRTRTRRSWTPSWPTRSTPSWASPGSCGRTSPSSSCCQKGETGVARLGIKAGKRRLELIKGGSPAGLWRPLLSGRGRSPSGSWRLRWSISLSRRSPPCWWRARTPPRGCWPTPRRTPNTAAARVSAGRTDGWTARVTRVRGIIVLTPLRLQDWDWAEGLHLLARLRSAWFTSLRLGFR